MTSSIIIFIPSYFPSLSDLQQSSIIPYCFSDSSSLRQYPFSSLYALLSKKLKLRLCRVSKQNEHRQTKRTTRTNLPHLRFQERSLLLPIIHQDKQCSRKRRNFVSQVTTETATGSCGQSRHKCHVCVSNTCCLQRGHCKDRGE